MSLGELAGVSVATVALVIGIVAAVLLAMQNSRLRRVERQLRSLMKGTGATTLTMSLGDIVAAQGERIEATQEQIGTLRQAIPELRTAMANSVQCVGLVRFNPFQETGGDQSFAVALLDKQGDGVVLSSLHGRSSTRFYAKPVKGGASNLLLSDEEQQAIRQAMGD